MLALTVDRYKQRNPRCELQHELVTVVDARAERKDGSFKGFAEHVFRR